MNRANYFNVDKDAVVFCQNDNLLCRGSTAVVLLVLKVWRIYSTLNAWILVQRQKLI